MITIIVHVLILLTHLQLYSSFPSPPTPPQGPPPGSALPPQIRPAGGAVSWIGARAAAELGGAVGAVDEASGGSEGRGGAALEALGRVEGGR